MERCAGRMWKARDFYATVTAIKGMGRGIYCASSFNKCGQMLWMSMRCSRSGLPERRIKAATDDARVQMHATVYVKRRADVRKRAQTSACSDPSVAETVSKSGSSFLSGFGMQTLSVKLGIKLLGCFLWSFRLLFGILTSCFILKGLPSFCVAFRLTSSAAPLSSNC